MLPRNDNVGGSRTGHCDLDQIGQLLTQATGIIATIVYTGIVSFILLKILDSVMGLRVDEDEEAEGLDVALHDERGYNLSS